MVQIASPSVMSAKNRANNFGRVAIAKEYLSNLKSLVAAVRKDTGVSGLPFLCGSVRRAEDPDNLSASVPERIAGPYPAIQWIVKAQWDPQKEIPHTNIVILRDIPSHPMNVHYNTAGQLQVGKLFADAYGRWASSGR